MAKKGIALLFTLLIIIISTIVLPSCKSCKKNTEAKEGPKDTTAIQSGPHVQSINLPHADSALAPVLGKIMDGVFEASRKKDYTTLASYLIYRGPDMQRMGYSTFNAKNTYERNVVRITADVFNKWNGRSETKDYARIFSLPQPDGRNMVVLEVIFVSREGVDQKFFGFLPLTKDKDDYKIADITSSLGVQ